jgi:hypothetical protein
MGLDALVFKSKASLENQFKGIAFDVDEHTGEASAFDDTDASIKFEDYVAKSVRFGNAAQISYLSHQVAEVLGSFNTFIERSVLYSGSHSGDVIEVDRLPELIEEVNKIRNSSSADVKRFAESLSSLVIVAQQNGNPIVFV